MESLRPDDPQRIGPYEVVARFDCEDRGRERAPERRFVGRLPGGGRTVVIGMPRPGADAERFVAEAEAEAEAARRGSAGAWIAPVSNTGGAGGDVWYAYPYLPAVPLPGALAAYGGPLPERTVRALGAALAEALAGMHAQGTTHGGVSPAAVLLAADGPRLTCAGAHRSGPPGFASGLPPEAAGGGESGPPGDIHGLGSVLAYAATGHAVPERRELPEGLRNTVARCLARDPGIRPQAGPLLLELTRTDEAPDGGAAVGMLGPGWLPRRVVGVLIRHSAELLATETRAPDPHAPGPAYSPTSLGER